MHATPVVVPATMRHVAVAAPGGPEAMSLAEGPVPRVRPDEVLIAVEYAGVNRPDLLQRAGNYPPPEDASPTLGLEVAGTIAAVGADVRGWRPGDPVCALTPGGGYAEYCTTPAGFCLPLPQGLGMREAASLPETFFTVWNNVFDRGALAPGESLLVHGGASGIGVTAIQLAKALGSTVFATVGSAAKAQACKALGADHAFNYREQDYAAEIARITGKRGVDVILNILGGDSIPRDLRSLATDGRLVIIGLMQGATSNVDWRLFMVKRQTITGSTLRASPKERKVEIALSLRKHAWPLIEAGKVKPVIHAEFPVEQAGEAHRVLEASEQIGKVVLRVRG